MLSARQRSLHYMYMWATTPPVPQISEGFRAITNNYEENIVRSIGTFTTKQFFTEKWKTERRMRKPLRFPSHSE